MSEKKRKYTKPPTLQDSRTMSDEQFLRERFWPKVKKSEGCWEWTAGVHPRGYGIVIYRGRKERAHRVLKALTSGLVLSEIPKKLFACHTCDNRLCVNPDHVFWGSNHDNVRDAVRKGRMKGGGRKNGDFIPHPQKLTEDLVCQIRFRYHKLERIKKTDRGDNAISLAAEFGVTERTVRDVANFRSWKWLKNQTPAAQAKGRGE